MNRSEKQKVHNETTASEDAKKNYDHAKLYHRALYRNVKKDLCLFPTAGSTARYLNHTWEYPILYGGIEWWANNREI